MCKKADNRHKMKFAEEKQGYGQVFCLFSNIGQVIKMFEL